MCCIIDDRQGIAFICLYYIYLDKSFFVLNKIIKSLSVMLETELSGFPDICFDEFRNYRILNKFFILFNQVL